MGPTPPKPEKRVAHYDKEKLLIHKNTQETVGKMVISEYPFSLSTVQVADDTALRANTNSCLEPNALGVVRLD